MKFFDKMLLTKLCRRSTFRPKCHSTNEIELLIDYQFLSFLAVSNSKHHLSKWEAGICFLMCLFRDNFKQDILGSSFLLVAYDNSTEVSLNRSP